MKKPFHLFLISSYFVLALLGLNINQVKPTAAYRSLIFAILAAGVLWGLMRLLIRDWGKAAILSSIYLLLFFSYGHVYHLLEPITILGILIGRHRNLIPVWILIAALLTWLVLRKIINITAFHVFLNILGITALAFPIFQVTSYTLRNAIQRKSILSNQISDNRLHLPIDQAPPDIYYIILDGYAREDVLEKLVGFDNSEFLNRLREIGFYIADCSQSNYSQTSLSITSALNYNYLEATIGDYHSNDANASVVIQYLTHSAARQELQNLGYSFVTFETSYYWLRIIDSDFYFSPEKSAIQQGEKLLPVNAFEAMLLRESAAVILTDSASVLSRIILVDMDYPYKEHRELILYTLDKLKGVPLEIPSPKFVYAHIISPHFPVVFDRNGDYVNVRSDAPNDIYALANSEQIRYLNQRILALVQDIIDVSATPPIIVLQADHGYDRATPEERMAILNAYYLPHGIEQQLYPSITPVNTFRVIFNNYFGGQLQILEDQSYYSQYGAPFKYTPVVNSCIDSINTNQSP